MLSPGMALTAASWAAGICTMTCHKAHNVFDVVPGDVVGSVILTTAAATVQVSNSRRNLLPLQSLCMCMHSHRVRQLEPAVGFRRFL